MLLLENSENKENEHKSVAHHTDISLYHIVTVVTVAIYIYIYTEYIRQKPTTMEGYGLKLTWQMAP